ncbi:MAG: HAD-IB family hydrolase [Cyclobacteriaceae bacterium]|nr:HAD-IB family hydrolase [Cyclobacteriaceae bacterium]
MSRSLALFDFDGTITSRDTLLEFIKFASGKARFYRVMTLFAPLIIYYKWIKKDGEIAKQKVLSHLFEGKSENELKQLGQDFADTVIPGILYQKAMEAIEKCKQASTRVVVISASLDIWLAPWAQANGVELVCTQMEFNEGKFTGRFATANCNGIEKVNRIKALLSTEDYHPIYAYGNSSGDKEMLALASHGYFRHFEN